MMRLNLLPMRRNFLPFFTKLQFSSSASVRTGFNTPNKLLTLTWEPYTLQVVKTDGEDGGVLASDVGQPDGVWIDRKAGHIYWTSMGENKGKHFSDHDGTIERINLDGSNRTVILPKGSIVTPKQITSAGGYLYFCDREGLRVMRCKLDGSGLEVLVQRGNISQDIDDIERHCVGIAINADTNTMYWTQKGPPKGGKGRIFAAPAVKPSDASSRSDISLLAEDLPEPIDLHLSNDGRRLYWTDRGAAPDGNSLNVAEITSDGLTNHRVIARGLVEAIGLAIDDAESVSYVADLGGNIWHIDLSSGDKRVIRKQSLTTGICFY